MRLLLFLCSLFVICQEPVQMAGPETFATSLLGAWRADTLSGSDLVDLSGNGRTLTAFVGASYGTTTTANGWGVAGKAIAIGNGSSAYYTAAAAAPWAPMSDGTGATIGLIFRPVANGAKQVLFDTGAAANSPFVRGMYVWYDPVLERIGLEFTNGTDRVIDWLFGSRFSWTGTCKAGKPHALWIVISSGANPNVEVWLDGHQIDLFNVDDRQRGSSVADPEPRTFAAGAPGFPLRVMANAHSAVQLFQGDWAEHFVAAAVNSSTVRGTFFTYASTTYGITLDTSYPGLVIFDGNSRTDKDWRTGQWPEVVTPYLNQPALYLDRAVAGMTLTNEVTRSTKQVTPFYDATRPFNVVVVWGDFINAIAAGMTKETCLANYLAYCASLRAQGWTVIGPTEPTSSLGTTVTDYLTAGILAAVGTSIDVAARLDQVSALSNASYATDYNGGAGPKAIWSDADHFTVAANKNYVAPAIVTAINSLSVMPRRFILQHP